LGSAKTRDGCATQQNAATAKELVEHEEFLESLGGMEEPLRAFSHNAEVENKQLHPIGWSCSKKARSI
jgi:hypothetical protein